MPREDRIFGWSTGAHPAVDIAQEIGLESSMEPDELLERWELKAVKRSDREPV